MTEGARVPKLRFQGFNAPWEEHSLEQLFDRAGSGGTPNSSVSKYYNGEIPFLSISDIKGRYVYSTSNSITEVGLQNSAAWIVPKGSIALAMYASVGKVAITAVNLATSQAFFNMVFSDTVLRDFVYTRLVKADIDKEWESLISTGTQSNLNAEKLRHFSILVPMSEEQNKISKLYSHVDTLIDLNTQKHQKLVELKQAMLEKMFPREGETVPELRFPGFTEPWKEFTLGQLGKARSGIGFPESQQGGVTGIPFFKVSDMNTLGNQDELTKAQNYVTPLQIATLKWTPINDLPAIFMAKVGAAVFLNRKRIINIPFLLDNNTMAYSLDLKKWDKFFAKPLFDRIDLSKLVQVGALPSYTTTEIERIAVLVPSLEEQEAIGQFFTALDDRIAKMSRRVDKLKQLKQALLEKMFV